jgi:hypothetical protein
VQRLTREGAPHQKILHREEGGSSICGIGVVAHRTVSANYEFHAAEIWISCGLVSRVFFTEASILDRKQSGDVQESLRTSGKSSLLNPVRFGQLAHEPTSGTSVSSCLSNGADVSWSKMFDSIHAASNAEGVFMQSAAA